ncbi:hypothetical protein Bpfe_007919 [Biomphalaria pfeifferi]|uniref:Uncharacterized protein n=1 Tax=Biomphalaria pfeifferi TaxID=112525 RepID=A0AAD8BXI6_BIOPF|nr:hypothetical protein Bpfe_007919 [Biomphalaria pfeifferi]
MSGATSHFKAKVVKKTKTGGQLMKECDSVGVVPSDAPRGLDRTYPNGISVCVTDMSTSLEEQNLLFTNDSAQHFLNINVEDLAMNTFEPSFLSSQQTMRSCKNSLTFLSALLSAAGSTPATHFNAHKDPVLGSDFGDTHSLSVVKANTNISSKPELCISTDKNLKRMRKTSAVVSRLSSIERTNPRDKFMC